MVCLFCLFKSWLAFYPHYDFLCLLNCWLLQLKNWWLPRLNSWIPLFTLVMNIVVDWIFMSAFGWLNIHECSCLTELLLTVAVVVCVLVYRWWCYRGSNMRRNCTNCRSRNCKRRRERNAGNNWNTNERMKKVNTRQTMPSLCIIIGSVYRKQKLLCGCG